MLILLEAILIRALQTVDWARAHRARRRRFRAEELRARRAGRPGTHGEWGR